MPAQGCADACCSPCAFRPSVLGDICSLKSLAVGDLMHAWTALAARPAELSMGACIPGHACWLGLATHAMLSGSEFS